MWKAQPHAGVLMHTQERSSENELLFNPAEGGRRMTSG